MEGGDCPLHRSLSPPSPPRAPAAEVPRAPAAPVPGMQIMREWNALSGVSPKLSEFMAGLLRGSTQCTYVFVWKYWLSWCESKDLEPIHFSESSLAEYLWFLFSVKHLSPASFAVHRAAIGSFLDPLGTASHDSKLLSHFMKAAFLSKPSASVSAFYLEHGSSIGLSALLGKHRCALIHPTFLAHVCPHSHLF